MKKLSISLFALCMVVLSACGGGSSSSVVCTVEKNSAELKLSLEGDKKIDKVSFDMDVPLSSLNVEKDEFDDYMDEKKKSAKGEKGISFDGKLNGDNAVLNYEFTITDLSDENKNGVTMLTGITGEDLKNAPKDVQKSLEDMGYDCK